MRNKKKQLLFGCLAALVLSAGAFPAFAQDQDSFSTNMESGSQNSVPVAVDITAVYGRNAKPGSFVPIKVSIVSILFSVCGICEIILYPAAFKELVP